MEIIEVDYGIANRFDKHIEINKNLKNYPSLYNSIIEHELSHTSEKGFTKKDFIIDFGSNKVSNWELLKFMFKYPKSLTQFLPFYLKERQLIYDINMLFIWSFMIIVLVFSIYLTIN